MGSNPTGFKVSNSTAGWNEADFEDIFVRKDCFLEGGLWLWGTNSSRELGNFLNTNASSPIQTISGGTNWRCATTNQNTTAALKTDGTLWLWGSNSGGRLGNNNTVIQSSPVQTISGGTNWRSVSLSTGSTAAIKTDGSLWVWGTGSYARLGDDSTINKSSPVQTVSGGNNWRSVSLGGCHSAAIKTDGTLWLWGACGAGRLGDNSTITKSSPVQTVSGGTNWRSVSLGGSHSAAIKTDGTLWLWGNGQRGRLGTNCILNTSSPVQTISGGTNWRSVSVGVDSSGATKTDGTLWTWGYNFNGQLGDGLRTQRSSPVQTISGGTNWRSVSIGCAHSAAIKTDGTLWTWGAGSAGKLGDNTVIDKSSPVQTVSGGTNWRSVNTNTHLAAIREDCW